MKVLVPVDGSECSERALRFGVEFAKRFDAELDVVHFTDVRGEDTERLLDRVEETLESEGVTADTAVRGDVRLDDLRASDQVGRNILDYARDHDHDHVVMGHHGAGVVERAILGSAAQTVVSSCDVGVTIVP